MRLRHIIVILLLCSLSSWSLAYELIVIQAVSSSKKTFVTRNGKRQGLMKGMTGTFTANDVSVLARALTVTGNFAQWEVINPDLLLPFEKGAMVTYYPATEYLWATMPEHERRKYIRSSSPDPRDSWIFRGAISRGLQESVSDAPAAQVNRGGAMTEIYWERELKHGFAFDLGLRYEREIINYENASFQTTRIMAIGDFLYYFSALKDYIPGRFYLGAGIGWGFSGTETVGLTQTGIVGLLPAAKAGLTYPFNDDWEFLIDTAFESLQTKEEQENGRSQTTTQTNLKTGIGLRYYY